MKMAIEKIYVGYLFSPLSLHGENFIMMAVIIDPVVSGSHIVHLGSGLFAGCSNWV